MIQPLRQRHYQLMRIMAVGLPLLFLAGLAARHAPLPQQVPALLINEIPAFPKMLLERDNLWPGQSIMTRVSADRIPPQRLVIELQPRRDLIAPDVLVYWCEASVPVTKQLPETAHLLGGLSGKHLRRFALPPAALSADGKMMLYSLAHQQIVATAILPTATLVRAGRLP